MNLPVAVSRGSGIRANVRTLPRVALVLGAGAARGFSHVGVLKVLEAARVPVHMVVGSSVGSLVGVLFAYGHTSYDIQKTAMALDRWDVIDFTVPNNGFVRGEKLGAFVNELVRDTPLEEFPTAFHAVATDIRTGREKVISSGSAGEAVRASCAIPGIFQPVTIGGDTCVDGGIVSPVAVDAARGAGADVVIAVDVSKGLDGTIPGGIVNTLIQSYIIMYGKIAEEQGARADVLIRPQVGHVFAGDFTKRHESILEGEKAARRALPEILGILEKVGA